MNDVDNKVKMIIEGLLLAAGRPLPLESIAAVFNEEERPENDELLGVLARIDEECGDRGFELTKVASGYRFQVKQELAEWVGKLWEERPPRYTRALLETLALVAYRQPITRGDIEEIRGVAVSSNIIRTLLDREWIRVVGQRDVPGRPSMFATTKQFLDYFNLESLQQLPALSEIRDIDGGAKDLGFEAELAAARVLEMPENAEDDASIELSDDEKAEMLAEEEAIALSQKPLDEILHPNGRPDLQGTEDDEEDAEENDDFAEIDEALAALEEDLGGDPSRLGEAIAGERNEGQLNSEESEGGSDDAVPTE
ncbi:MAG: SMC-Scp complex subunit ScpB [Gammaproteobacteria bacterium]|nr:SMC-Scp complex subunit ScpB [Gammaproteobacteria bacterium]